MTIYDWIPSITTSALLGLALWLSRSLILTRLTKSVQYEFDKKIERVRAELSQRLKINNFRYEKEFAVLVELSEAVFKYHEVAKDYGKMIVAYSRDKSTFGKMTEHEVKHKESYEYLRTISERYRPFYDKVIYNHVSEFNRVADDCANHAMGAASGQAQHQIECREKAESDVNKLLSISENITEAIRERVESWENVSLE